MVLDEHPDTVHIAYEQSGFAFVGLAFINPSVALTFAPCFNSNHSKKVNIT